MTTKAPPQRPRRRLAITSGLGLGGLGLGFAAAFAGAPVVLLNASPSEPPGLYARGVGAPAVGRIVAFRMPEAGRRYVEQAMPYLGRRPLLKAVAAGPGDAVCAGEGTLTINGRPRGAIADRDRLGRALPHWSGCRRLRPDELFMFSSRVPNSFDSRYFGTVSRQAVLGVYRLVAPFGSGAA